MDGRGRYLDNVFIERLWRSLKYEAVYLHELRNGLDAERDVPQRRRGRHEQPRVVPSLPVPGGYRIPFVHVSGYSPAHGGAHP